MKLHWSPRSPFVRKVMIVAHELGLADRIDCVRTVVATTRPHVPLMEENPLSKIPTLVLDDGHTLFDSRVILEYLDHLAGGGRILPREADARFAALRLQALCDGIMEASLLQVYEARYRPEAVHHQPWLDMQAGKAARGLAALEASPLTLDATPHVGQIALACALGYLDLRFKGKWRSTYPKLVAWLDRFAAQVPAFAATKVEPS